MKDQLVFDVTDAASIADSDSIGAYVRSSDGTLITHTTVGASQALDVNVASGVNVEVDLSHLDDSVRLGDGTDFFTSTTVGADIGLDVNLINASIEVTATNLDIRDLVFATDKVDVSGSTILGITNDVNIADGGNSITVDAINLDIRDLVAATDSIQSNMFDGAGTALTSTLIGADQALDVNVVAGNDDALANTAILTAAGALTLAGTAEAVVVSSLASRKYLSIYNNDNRKMYIGGAGVDATTGFPVSPGSYIEMRAGASVAVYFDSAKTGHKIRTLELS